MVPYRLCVRGRFAVDLVTAKDYKVGLLLVEHLGHKVQCPRVSLAWSAAVASRYGIPAVANAGAQVQVCDLHDLEAAIVPDPGPGLLHLVVRASPNS